MDEQRAKREKANSRAKNFLFFYREGGIFSEVKNIEVDL